MFNAKYLSDISFSSNDIALNSLLNLLPKKIYIHLVDNKIDEFIKNANYLVGSGYTFLVLNKENKLEIINIILYV